MGFQTVSSHDVLMTDDTERQASLFFESGRRTEVDFHSPLSVQVAWDKD